jgi:hypothetical protein
MQHPVNEGSDYLGEQCRNRKKLLFELLRFRCSLSTVSSVQLIAAFFSFKRNTKFLDAVPLMVLVSVNDAVDAGLFIDQTDD